jgi:hypothetical protein
MEIGVHVELLTLLPRRHVLLDVVHCHAHVIVSPETARERGTWNVGCGTWDVERRTWNV